MKICKSWLVSWVPACSHSLASLIELFTLAGLEVESTGQSHLPFQDLRIGEIVACYPHPNADNLQITTVEVGLARTLSIICGAPNCRPGIRIVCALAGAQLPNLSIVSREIRGELSEGMLCSYEELGFVSPKMARQGIIELPADAPIGTDPSFFWKLRPEEWMMVSITPNRGDCLSIYGMARELAALIQAPLCPPFSLSPLSPKILPAAPLIDVEESAQPLVRALDSILVRLSAESQTPIWIQQVLLQMGMKILPHPILNLLNYTMLELGQPLHAYDAARLHGSLRVRISRREEKAADLLYHEPMPIPAGCLVITDERHVQCIAGILGGKAACVTQETRSCIIEAGHFDPVQIAKTSRKLHLNTEASYRFERGVDPSLSSTALARVVQLVEAIGGTVEAIDVGRNTREASKNPITLTISQIERHLGTSFSMEELEEHLTRIGCQCVERQADQASFLPPSFRWDLRLPADLMEELIRLRGYHTLPATMPTGALQTKEPTIQKQQAALRAIKERLLARGYQEVINYSFVSKELAGCFAQPEELVILQNPLSQEMSTLRPMLLPSLMLTAKRNFQRQSPSVHCFELGKAFLRTQDNPLEIRERLYLGFLSTGKPYRIGWNRQKTYTPPDFFSIKAVMEELCQLVTFSQTSLLFVRSSHLHFHPYRQATCLHKGIKPIGCLGEVFPTIAEEFGYPQPIFYGELDIERLLSLPCTKDSVGCSRFPFIQRDLSFILQEDVCSHKVTNLCKEVGGPMLKELLIFDRYTGAELPTGCVALGLSFLWQDEQRTLRDEEVDKYERSMIEALQQQFGATLRGYDI